MKILINSGGREFQIGIPTNMIFSKPSLWLYLKFLRKGSAFAQRHMTENIEVSVNSLFDNIPEEAAYAICDELRRIKRKHGSWELLIVESSDGSRVMIIL